MRTNFQNGLEFQWVNNAILLLPPVYFAYEITKSVWKLTCYVFTMHANGGRGWWQFHGKKLEEECREFENPWWRAGSGGLEMNPSSIIIVLLWEMKVKLSTSNRFEANFTWEKRRKTECPAFYSSYLPLSFIYFSIWKVNEDVCQRQGKNNNLTVEFIQHIRQKIF